jgi:hypothetical protein
VGSREFDGHVGTAKGWAVEVLLVVDIDDGHYLMPTAEGYFFYHVAHLAVTD